MTAAPSTKTNIVRKLISRALHLFFLMRRGLTIGVRAVVRSDDGKFLLVRHTYTPGWHFPGGGVERGETAEEALLNELFQETGLEISGKPQFHGVFYNKCISKRDHVLVYLCSVTESVVQKPSSMEIAEIGYFDHDHLPPDTDAGTERRMREIVHGEAKSDLW